jgi:hypothetical protein
VEHVAEGQENNRGTSQGCSRGGDGVIKYFTISEKGDRGGYQKTITPSPLRQEDQVEVRLPLATLWVVLRNQLLIIGRPHPNVDVGWPAGKGARKDIATVVVHHRDDVGSASEFVVDVPEVGGPVLVPPPRGEQHHSLLSGRSLRFFEAIEVAMGG